MTQSDPAHREPKPRLAWHRVGLVAVILGVALMTAFVAYLLTTIYEHKQEAKNPYLRFVEVTSDTTDPAPWGDNWPREYDQYRKTVEATRTNFGGGDALSVGPDTTVTREKAETFPFLTRMFAGYAFSLDYRDRRGHAYMLLDQERTRRVTERPQPGACLNCHSSVVPTYLRLGGGVRSDEPQKQAEAIQGGFVKLAAMTYQQAHEEVVKTGSLNPVPTGTTQELKHVDGVHPVSCVDCHEPATMRLRVNRPAFVAGIRSLKEHQGVKDYDVNRDATRQEMRTFVCAQCHVEYYCGPKVTLFLPWNNGTKVEEIESYYDNFKFPDGHRFYDWVHAETGAELLKAQHPEFETWSQGVHARSGVTCADCHMPYERQGAMKVSDHWVRSPLLNINHACQQCHQYPEEEIKARVDGIQKRNLELVQRAGAASTDFLDAMRVVRTPFNVANRAAVEQQVRETLGRDAAFAKLAPEEQMRQVTAGTQTALNTKWAQRVAGDAGLKAVAELQRKAQWRLDFVAAENSMGFHAPQETARVLAESIDYFRQAQLAAQRLAAAPGTTTPQ